MTDLWRYIEGNDDAFCVSIPPHHVIDDLKVVIYKRAPNCFIG